CGGVGGGAATAGGGEYGHDSLIARAGAPRAQAHLKCRSLPTCAFSARDQLLRQKDAFDVVTTNFGYDANGSLTTRKNGSNALLREPRHRVPQADPNATATPTCAWPTTTRKAASPATRSMARGR